VVVDVYLDDGPLDEQRAVHLPSRAREPDARLGYERAVDLPALAAATHEVGPEVIERMWCAREVHRAPDAIERYEPAGQIGIATKRQSEGAGRVVEGEPARREIGRRDLVHVEATCHGGADRVEFDALRFRTARRDRCAIRRVHGVWQTNLEVAVRRGDDLARRGEVAAPTPAPVLGDVVHPAEEHAAAPVGCGARLGGIPATATELVVVRDPERPRTLTIPGNELDGVMYLRSVDDSDVLRTRLDRGGAVVVIGAGWIGAEVAASARQRGLDVTVVEPASVPLERVLGTEVGAIYRDVHTDHGVRMLLGTGVERFEGGSAVERVRTSDGRTVDCDFVVVGVGVQPRTALAARAGIAVENGVVADAHLQTGAPDVFVAGDVANAYHPFYGERVRVEHWANALHQGPLAARTMLGHDDVYDRLPYFFSDQYDVGMEYSGYATGADRVVFRGDPATREFIAFWLAEGRVVAGMNVNVWDVADTIRALIAAREPIDERRLTDPDVPLHMLIAGDHAALGEAS
jgi:3-phenylpropionate/trans-cinnamate dioxygenase ferredoxin reductase subunit